MLNLTDEQMKEEHYHPIRSEDYDFPMSDTFRGWTYQYIGIPDPGYEPSKPETDLEEQLPNQLITKTYVRIDRKALEHEDRISSLEGELKHIHEGLHQKRERSKKRERPKWK